MAKIQLIENERGRIAIVKKVWGCTMWYYVHDDKWRFSPMWYSGFTENFIVSKFEDLLDRPSKPKKSRKVRKQASL